MANNIQLVNNFDFINYSMSIPNPALVPQPDPVTSRSIPRRVANALLSNFGASPYESVSTLKKSLTDIVVGRLFRGLETSEMTEPFPHTSIDTCSAQSASIGQRIQDAIDNGEAISKSWEFVRGYLAMVK